MRLGYITDLHYRGAVPGTSAIAKRRCRQALGLLERALDRFCQVGVDGLVCTGDLVDDPDHPAALEDLESLGRAMASLGVPLWILPGNHDPAPDAFFQVLPMPQPRDRLRGWEVLSFHRDAPTHGQVQAVRSPQSLAQMAAWLAAPVDGLEGTLCLQHYFLWPERNQGYPHNYGNDAAIREIMEAAPRRIVSVSGHYHPGVWATRHHGVTYLAGSALCEAPHRHYVLDLGEGHVSLAEYYVEEA